MDSIAHELIEKFKLNVVKHPNSLEWFIKDVKYREMCDPIEREHFDLPNSLDCPLLDENNPELSLPPALRYSIDPRIAPKVNHIVVNMFKSMRECDESFKITATTNKTLNKTNDFQIPILAKDIFEIDEKKFLDKLKKYSCCL